MATVPVGSSPPTYSQIMNDAQKGTLTKNELDGWISTRPSFAQFVGVVGAFFTKRGSPALGRSWVTFAHQNAGKGSDEQILEAFAVEQGGKSLGGGISDLTGAAAKTTTQEVQGVGAGAGIVTSWFNSIGGMIASGIEQGIISVFKDLWAAIEGPVMIIGGAILAILVLGIYFKNDLGPLAVAAMA